MSETHTTQLTEQQFFDALVAWKSEIGCDYVSVCYGYSESPPDIHVACYGGIKGSFQTVAEAKAFVAKAKDPRNALRERLAKLNAEKANTERKLRELHADTPEDGQEPPDGSGSVSGMLEAGENNLETR